MTGHDPVRRDSDEGLIRRILSGEEAALGVLYDRYGGRVYAVAKRIPQDDGAAEEILQNIFHQLWRNAASLDSAHGALGSWLLVMARNRSIDRLRRRVPGAVEEITSTLHTSGPDIESAAAANELADRVREAMELGCSPGCRLMGPLSTGGCRRPQPPLLRALGSEPQPRRYLPWE
ncbi:MAG: sigma factor [Terriglobia bacterium]